MVQIIHAVMGSAGSAGMRVGTQGEVPDGGNTLFWIASLTKALTSVAAMQLIERGTLALDQPAAELLPTLGAIRVLTGFANTGEPILRMPARAITVRHLLTHTAGFSYPIWNETMLRYVKHAGIPPVAAGRRAALDIPLLFDPGARWEYGISTDWLGLLVEAATGRTLDGVLADGITGPLRMVDTTFTPDAGQRARALPMRRRTADGGLETIPFGGGPAPEFFSGGGGLWGTVPDYLRFLRAMLGGGALNGSLDGARILRPETVDAMGRDQLAALGLSVPPLGTVPGDPLGLEAAGAWGLGFLIHQRRGPTGRSAGSLAWSGMANCYYWIDHAREVAGVFMTQILPFYDEEALAAAAAFERGVYAAL